MDFLCIARAYGSVVCRGGAGARARRNRAAAGTVVNFGTPENCIKIKKKTQNAPELQKKKRKKNMKTRFFQPLAKIAPRVELDSSLART